MSSDYLMISSSSRTEETLRFLQKVVVGDHYNNNLANITAGNHNHWNKNHTTIYDEVPPHHHHQEAMEDEDVPVILKIMAAAWIIFMALVCYKAEQRELQEDERRAEQRRRRREQRMRQRKFAPSRRKTAVSAAIVTKKMTDSSGAGVMDQGDHHLQEDNEDMTCTICLEPFEAGQDLSFSRDLKCHHCFHRDCLIPWMMRNDECPMCRTRLVEDDGKEDLNDIDFDDEEDLMEERFRIVNGLVRFASMLGHDRRHISSLGDATSASGTTNTTVEVQEVEMTEVMADAAVNDSDDMGKAKGRKKKRRKGDRRDYSALSMGDNGPVMADTENIQQEQQDDNYTSIV